MNIHCPNCEHACSESAAICPKCGHPLQAGLKERLGRQIGHRWRALWVSLGVLVCVLSALVTSMVLSMQGREKPRETLTGQFEAGSGKELSLKERVAEAYRSTLSPERRATWALWNDPMELHFKRTLRVAEILGEDKEEWLGWAFGWAITEWEKPTEYRGYYAMPMEYIYNLTDDEEFARSVLSFWTKIKATEGKANARMPLIVSVTRENGVRRYGWDDSVCWEQAEALEENRLLAHDEDHLVKRQIEGGPACWCYANVVRVTYFKRSRAE